MTLTRYRLGDLIEQVNKRNKDVDNIYTVSDVRGISNQKEFIETKAKMNGVSLDNYKLVKPKEFVYITVTSRNGDKLSVAFNNTNETYIVSSSYIAFKVEADSKIIEDYLFMILNRTEFDRLSRINSWGSARETLSWEDFCDIKIDLPPLDIQKKYVAIYKAILENQKAYEKGLEDLKLACDSTIENIKRKYESSKIGPYIKRIDKRNSDNSIKNVKGVSTMKQFREPTSKVNKNNLNSYKIVNPGEISFVQTTHNEKVFAYALNDTDEKIVVTSVNEVFSTDERLLPEYLSMFFNRKEFDRYARFNSWGSARETFTWNNLVNVKVPIVDINLQKYVSDIYKVYTERKEINEKLKARLKNICPILIKGAVEEAKRKEA